MVCCGWHRETGAVSEQTQIGDREQGIDFSGDMTFEATADFAWQLIFSSFHGGENASTFTAVTAGHRDSPKYTVHVSVATAVEAATHMFA